MRQDLELPEDYVMEDFVERQINSTAVAVTEAEADVDEEGTSKNHIFQKQKQKQTHRKKYLSGPTNGNAPEYVHNDHIESSRFERDLHTQLQISFP